MTDIPSRMPRQPKLRSSCDACGASKLKCDRGRPQCGRCAMLGRDCIYGYSRKMGKPSKDKRRLPEPRPATSEQPAGREKNMDDQTVGDLGRIPYESLVIGSTPASSSFMGQAFSETNDPPDGCFNVLPTSMDTLDSIHGDLFGPILSAGSSSLVFGHDISTHGGSGPVPTPTTTTTTSDDYPTPTALTESPFPHLDEGEHSPPFFGHRSHDCTREARIILDSLSIHPFNNGYSTPASESSAVDRVPLDKVLRLNKECIKRLGHLLDCPCSGSPHLALIYASIIFQILVWYQQAAGCAQQAALQFPAEMSQDIASRVTSPAFSVYGSREGSLSWSNADLTTLKIGEGDASINTAVAPSKMVIGSFNVEDLSIQTAMNIQLLLGEMKRAGQVIEQFTSRHNFADEQHNTLGEIDNLYRCLDSWLKTEHSKIANMMKAKLRELDI